MAMATYVGQNHGARRTDRIRQGIKDGCMVQLLYCAVAWGVIFFIKPYAVGLVLGDADPAVTAGAIQYLSVMSMLFCFHGLLMIFRNTLQGLGYSVLAIVSGVGELIGRSLGGVLAVKTALGIWASAFPIPLLGVWQCSTACSWSAASSGGRRRSKPETYKKHDDPWGAPPRVIVFLKKN